MYSCGRNRPGGPILVSTAGAYVVAEYNERTGKIRWQRVVHASQKANIEHWLSQHFPCKPETTENTSATHKPRAAARAAR